jgi:uncharacterized protein YbjT (DUF2867 family)/uncharacterized membrane protein YphA (DoxX/SURF4 family)
MHIFLTGSSGFIGQHLLRTFVAHGHTITCAVRSLPAVQMTRVHYVVADFSQHLSASDWIPYLHDMDVVVNAVGIIREIDNQTFEILHTRAPIALFEASTHIGVGLIVQISALGADDEAASRYHQSKKMADDFLKQCKLPAVILQPSLVYGHGGASASLFNTLASMPILAKFGDGRQMVQPVHVDDVVDSVVCSLGHQDNSVKRVAIVGPSAMTLTEFLGSLRRSMKMRPAFIFSLPLGLARLAAGICGKYKKSPLDRETFAMLERGNTADAGEVSRLLGRPPREVSEFLEAGQIASTRRIAQLNWLLPVLRISIALVWIVTGLISFGIYPISDSYILLERVGVPGALAPLMLYGAAVFDLLIGIALLFIRKKWIWRVQLVLIIFYTVVIAWKLPEFLIHPYGPLLKNLPMLAAIFLMHELEEE